MDDLAAVPGSVNVVSDSDGDGQIEIDNNQFSVGQRLSVTTWSSLDGKFTVTADLSQASQTLAIRNKVSGSTILVKNWNNGAFGIELGGDIPVPSTTPLTSDDDLFGHGGNNTGGDYVAALGGNDGLSAGVGNDYLDAGDGNDLMYGGSGNDTLLGGLGTDIIVDDSELLDLQDWSDDVGADGTSQRQREESRIQQLGAAVIAKGKGWYVYTTQDGSDTVYNIVTANGTQMLDPGHSPSGDDRIEGGGGDDVIWSGEGSDTVYGGADADYVDGGADDDVIYGGDGADKIWGDTPTKQVTEGSSPSVVSAAAQKNGNDILYGGAGSDTVDGGGGNDLIDGGDGADLLLGNGNPEAVDQDDPDMDVIDGGIGNDTIFGDDGNDTIHGGTDDDLISGDDPNSNTRDGNDRLYGDAGNDTVLGGGGDDTVYGGIGDDSIMGDSNLIDGSRHGNDVLYGGDGSDFMAGGGGDDFVLGEDGNDLMHGDNDASVLDAQYDGNDYVEGGKGEDTLYGDDGDDTLSGGADADVLSGGKGSDFLYGGDGADQLTGDEGDDRLEGNDGNDSMWGEAGSDVLYGDAGDDLIMGDDPNLPADQLGSDSLYGGTGNDSLHGGGEDDQLYGGAGADQLFGNDGDDLVVGDEGNDVLDGGAGNDLLVGGDGSDTFFFGKNSGYDTIESSSADGSTDIVQFGAGITASGTRYQLVGDDLNIVADGGGGLLIEDFFAPTNSTELYFDDGTLVTKTQLAASLNVPTPITGSATGGDVDGSDQNDRIYGGAAADTLYGYLGNDFLSGLGGNDTLYGGPGNDTMEGGTGDDTYYVGGGFDVIMGLGDADAGSDTIIMSGASTDSVSNFQISGDDLYLFLKNGDGVKLDGFLSGRNGTHVIRLSDGREWTAADFGGPTWAGTSGDDVYTGTDANEILDGGAGNDSISGAGGMDKLNGDDGDDTLSGAIGDDILNGGAGNDVLNGGDGADQLSGGSGQDVLNGGAGNDDLIDTIASMYGGPGDDSYYIIQGPESNLVRSNAPSGYLPNTVEKAGEGTDTVYTNLYDAVLPDNVENLVVRTSIGLERYPGGVAPRIMVGNDLDNVITVDTSSGTDIGGTVYLLDGGAGADTLTGSTHDDTYVVDNPGDVIVEPDTGASQSFDIVRAAYSFHLDSVSNIEEVQLTGSDDISAWGTDGADTLDGSLSSGSNVLTGGAGDDDYVVGTGDTIVEAADGGNDTVTLAMGGAAVANDTTFSLADYVNIENAKLDNRLRYHSNSCGGNLDGTAQDNVLTGNDFINVIHGGDGNDTISGGLADGSSWANSSRDLLYGDAGDDHLISGPGGADLYGGTGNDLLEGSQGRDVIHYDMGDGTDTIDSPIDKVTNEVKFGANVTTDDVSFSRDGTTLIVQVGADASNQVRVNDYWADTSDGAALTGAIDQFVFADGTIRKGGLDHLPYTNNPPVTQILSQRFDVTKGKPVSFQLPQNMFTDAPDDTLTLSLQQAPSWLSIDPSTGLLTGTSPTDAQDVQFGITATDSWGQTASASLSMRVYNPIQGTSGDDTLTGTSGHDVIEGLAGNDVLDGGSGTANRLIGGAGDDTYKVHDSATVIVENAGEGTDTVVSDADYALGANLERLILAPGTQATRARGNSADNELVGNDASNILDGAGGADTMRGGDGNDTYYVDQSGDQVQEGAGEGTDLVKSSVSWTLSDNVENLTLLGTENLDATGNALNNVLQGNADNNRIDGAGGDDTMSGGLGDDYYVIDSAGDQIFEDAGAGTDTEERLFESNRALDDNVERLVLGDGVKTGNGNSLDDVITGNAADNTLAGYAGEDVIVGNGGADTLFGGAGNDQLSGGAGNDYLDGGTGADQMAGGSGDDVYVVDDAGDTIQEHAGEGTDQVHASVSYTLSDNVENLFLKGSQNVDGTGNAGNNYLSGNADDNTIRGMDGDDTLAASGGNDVLIGGAGNDAYVFDGTAGSATIDNTGGGNDGVFFTNGITADRLSFAQDGNDLLVYLDDGANPVVRVQNHFLGGDASLDFLQTSDGTTMTTDQINQAVSQAPAQYDQTIVGTSAADQLSGTSGKDLIQGLGGDDHLFGMAGDDDLQGGAGNDYLSGGDGSSIGSGVDTLEGGDGNDTLAGEDGANTLVGGLGDDQYIYGGGQDTIDNSDGGNDGIFFNDGITASDLAFSRDGDDLVITVGGVANNTVRVANHFLGGDSAIDYVQPASGSMLDTATINGLADPSSGGTGGTSGETGNDADYSNVVDGTDSSEQLLGTSGRDLIHGLGGDDTIFGFGGDDKFEGGAGNDYLSGGNGSFSGSGNDILIGGAGDDTLVGEDGEDMLIGGTGNDQYVWQTGSGSDTIDNAGGGTDWLFFNDIDRTRLGFHQDGDDLIIMVDDDSAQSVRVKNYFLGGDYAISYVQPSDGYAIPASDIDSLLTPMPTGASATAAAVAMEPVTVDAAEAGVRLPAGESVSTSRPSREEPSDLFDKRNHLFERAIRSNGVRSSLGSAIRPYGAGEDLRSMASFEPSPQVHRLIQAMSNFDGDPAGDIDLVAPHRLPDMSLGVWRHFRDMELTHGEHEMV